MMDTAILPSETLRFNSLPKTGEDHEERSRLNLNDYVFQYCKQLAGDVAKKYFKEFYSQTVDLASADDVADTFATSDYTVICQLDIGDDPDWTMQALQELEDLYNECSQDNWDGYGASAVSAETYFEVSKILNLLPKSFPEPEIDPEPDGGIGLEWYKEPGISFVISVNGTNIMTYAGLFGENSESHGTERFDVTIPTSILHMLDRLQLKNE